MMVEVPSMAIYEVIIIENSSPMKDETLAHRLGFIPLTTELEDYILPDNCTCNSELGCSKCSVTLTLEVEAPNKIRTIYSKELKSYDPKIVPVSNKIPIVKIAPDQKIRLEAYAKLGLGRDHVKWQPTSQCTYKYASALHIVTKRCDLCQKCVEACPKRILEIDGKVRIIDYTKCNVCKECEKACPKDAIKVEALKDTFIFTLESTGSLPPEKIFLESVKILKEKTDDFIKQLSDVK